LGSGIFVLLVMKETRMSTYKVRKWDSRSIRMTFIRTSISVVIRNVTQFRILTHILLILTAVPGYPIFISEFANASFDSLDVDRWTTWWDHNITIHELYWIQDIGWSKP
jgi:hypothetical protein